MGLIGKWLTISDIDKDTTEQDELNDQYQAGCLLFGEEVYKASVRDFTSKIHKQCQDALIEDLCIGPDPDLSDTLTWMIDRPTLLQHRHLRWDVQGLLDRKHDLIELIRTDPQRFHHLLGGVPIRCDDITVADVLQWRCFTWDRETLSVIPGLTTDDKRRIDLAYQAITRLIPAFGQRYYDLEIVAFRSHFSEV